MGVAVALVSLPPIERRYVDKFHKNGGHLPPEERLTGMMIGKLMATLHIMQVLPNSSPSFMADRCSHDSS